MRPLNIVVTVVVVVAAAVRPRCHRLRLCIHPVVVGISRHRPSRVDFVIILVVVVGVHRRRHEARLDSDEIHDSAIDVGGPHDEEVPFRGLLFFWPSGKQRSSTSSDSNQEDSF